MTDQATELTRAEVRILLYEGPKDLTFFRAQVGLSLEARTSAAWDVGAYSVSSSQVISSACASNSG